MNEPLESFFEGTPFQPLIICLVFESVGERKEFKNRGAYPVADRLYRILVVDTVLRDITKRSGENTYARFE